MPTKRKRFLMYADWKEAFVGLPSDGERVNLLYAIFEYSQSGNVPELSPIASYAFNVCIRNRMDLDTKEYTQKCEKNKENAKRRWDTQSADDVPNHATACERIQTQENKCDGTLDIIDIIDNIDLIDSIDSVDNNLETANAVSREDADALPSENPAPRSGKNEAKISYRKIGDMYNSICPSLPKMTALSDARKKMIRERLKHYTEEQIVEVFAKAEASSFLRGEKGGKDGRTFRANFDWLMKDANFAKTLDGNYDDKNTPALSQKRMDELDGIF